MTQQTSHYRNEVFRFSQIDVCLPSQGMDTLFRGAVVDLPPHAVPADIPSPLMDEYVDLFATQPEEALTQFLEVYPNFGNPRDIGRILFHTPKLSPFAISVILFNSIYSSRALMFSFISAIDLDCLSIVDAIRYVTQKVAIPSSALEIVHLARSFATAYELRNQLEWPNVKVVHDLFCAALNYCVIAGDFLECTKPFKSLENVSKYVLTQIGKELSDKPPGLFFALAPTFTVTGKTLEADVEHEGRFRSSWKSYKYFKIDDVILCKDSKGKMISQIPLQNVTAHHKTGIAKKPWCLILQRIDNMEFGTKVKDGSGGKSMRKSYTVSFKTEAEMLTWMSSINLPMLEEELKKLN